MMNRRSFLKQSICMAGGLGFVKSTVTPLLADSSETLFNISLAQWSLHHSIRDGILDHLDFAVSAKRDYGIEAVEYVNTLFMDKAEDKTFLKEMKTRAEGEGVRSLLIMCDSIDPLVSADEKERLKAVEGHYPWITAAHFLGCGAIRINARGGQGSPQDQAGYFADSMHRLGEFGDDYGINILVENHGGISSNRQWVVDVMKKVNHPRCGTLPDFGNSEIADGEVADPYQLVAALMPYAKGHVSAKAETFEGDGYLVGVDSFQKNGQRVIVNYMRIVKIVLEAGFKGFIGIEYQGPDSSHEPTGIRKTKALLKRVREELSL